MFIYAHWALLGNSPIKSKTLQQLGCGTNDESMGFRKRTNYTKTLKAEWFIGTENLGIQKLVQTWKFAKMFRFLKNLKYKIYEKRTTKDTALFLGHESKTQIVYR